jgi:hypothetical protein
MKINKRERDRQTDIQRRADRQMEDRQTDGRKMKINKREKDRQKDRQTKTGRQTDRWKTDRQMEEK